MSEYVSNNFMDKYISKNQIDIVTYEDVAACELQIATNLIRLR